MLYLTRKLSEAVIINDVIEVTVIEIQGKSVKLGFKFPAGEKVLRRELHDKIKAETEAAANDVLAVQRTLFDISTDIIVPEVVVETVLESMQEKSVIAR